MTPAELKLCNCDGFWHVECPDGITRYISEESLDAYATARVIVELEQLSREDAEVHETPIYGVTNKQIFDRIKTLTAPSTAKGDEPNN